MCGYIFFFVTLKFENLKGEHLSGDHRSNDSEWDRPLVPHQLHLSGAQPLPQQLQNAASNPEPPASGTTSATAAASSSLQKKRGNHMKWLHHKLHGSDKSHVLVEGRKSYPCCFTITFCAGFKSHNHHNLRCSAILAGHCIPHSWQETESSIQLPIQGLPSSNQAWLAGKSTSNSSLILHYVKPGGFPS